MSISPIQLNPHLIESQCFEKKFPKNWLVSKNSWRLATGGKISSEPTRDQILAGLDYATSQLGKPSTFDTYIELSRILNPSFSLRKETGFSFLIKTDLFSDAFARDYFLVEWIESKDKTRIEEKIRKYIEEFDPDETTREFLEKIVGNAEGDLEREKYRTACERLEQVDQSLSDMAIGYNESFYPAYITPTKNDLFFYFPSISEDKLRAVFEEYETHSKNKNPGDALSKEAVSLYQKLERLRPSLDGNQSAHLILLAKLLIEAGFDPPLLKAPQAALFLCLDDWEKYVREGIKDWQELEKSERFHLTPLELTFQRSSIADGRPTYRKALTLFCGLGLDGPWMQMIDQKLHVFGPDVIDAGIDGNAPQKKFTSSIQRGFDMAAAYLKQPLTPSSYLKIHEAIYKAESGADIDPKWRSKDFDSSIETCFQKYRSEMGEIHSLFAKNSGQENLSEKKLELIARLIQDLQRLRPFADQQKRTDLMLLSKLLCEEGFNPPLLNGLELLCRLPFEEWKGQLKEGMQKWREAKAKRDAFFSQSPKETPPQDFTEAEKETKTFLFEYLKDNMWKQMIDGEHHSEGCLVYESDRKDHEGEPGYLGSMQAAFAYAKDNLFAPLTVSLYKDLHKHTSRHLENIAHGEFRRDYPVSVKGCAPEPMTLEQSTEKAAHLNQIAQETSAKLGAEPFCYTTSFELNQKPYYTIFHHGFGRAFFEKTVELLLARYESCSSDPDLGPIDHMRLIAELFQNLEQLHPFYDAQTRTDVVLGTMLLVRRGLNPTLFHNPNLAFFTTPDEWFEIFSKAVEAWREEAGMYPSWFHSADSPNLNGDAEMTEEFLGLQLNE
ncbi:MAG: hypothetical protein A3E80_06270 [Chlamydiae bacterium RIFCSPHIGHO2_12_FULL_49_9]|nr:MAG: hypothetical protein A3E80_06270 [Chlamydiae bacterium RIFCSPHIGHO2_12_FULL_49_9]